MSTKEIPIPRTRDYVESPLNLLWFHTAPSGPGSKLQSEIVPESLPIFEQAVIGIAILDHRCIITRANRAFAQMLKTQPHQLERSTLAEFTHPEDLDSDAADKSALASRKIDNYSVVKRLVRSDGAVRWVKLTYSSIQSGFVSSGFLLCADDVTKEFSRFRGSAAMNQDPPESFPSR